MLKLKVRDPADFKLIVQSLTRFVRRANLEVSKYGIRVKSIDPHDFCFVDLSLSRDFFEDFEPDGSVSLDLDFSKLPKIAPYLATGKNLEIDVGPHGMTLLTQSDWGTAYTISPYSGNPLGIGEPKSTHYPAEITVRARDFVQEIRKAAAISHELTLSVNDGSLQLAAKSGDYLFNASQMPSRGANVSRHRTERVSAQVILDYIRLLGTLIERADEVTLHMAPDAPLKIDFSVQKWGSFTFYLSHRKLDATSKTRTSRSGESLPRISITRFPEYCKFLSGASPTSIKEMRLAQFETKGGDYTRLGAKLGFVRTTNRSLKITQKGRQWVELHEKNLDSAKQALHRKALVRIRPYREMIKLVLQRPMSQEEIFHTLADKAHKAGRHPPDQQDVSTLVGLAVWCDALDRNFGIYYFGRVGE